MSLNWLDRQEIVRCLGNLSGYLLSPKFPLDIGKKASEANPWFTRANVDVALRAIGKSLEPEKVTQWLSAYPENGGKPLRCGLILAGNIPAVGFQDILAVIASGNKAVIKLSSQDRVLIPHLLENLVKANGNLRHSFDIVERLTDYDTVIATGSNNSSRYFEYYFSKVPHIIRKNRNSVAVLTSEELRDDYEGLGNDIFRYFGLGCRNVSKLYVPHDYNFERFFTAIEHWNHLMDFHKYAHNFDYQLTLSMINRLKHYSNGFLVLNENASMHSPIAALHYQRYQNLDEVRRELQRDRAGIQCICALQESNLERSTPFGTTQEPELWDYADGVDVMHFLLDLQNVQQ